jgi:hypothetical protein
MKAILAALLNTSDGSDSWWNKEVDVSSLPGVGDYIAFDDDEVEEGGVEAAAVKSITWIFEGDCLIPRIELGEWVDSTALFQFPPDSRPWLMLSGWREIDRG